MLSEWSRIGVLSAVLLKGGGTEMTDGTQNISRGVEEQEEVVREGDQVKKRPKEIWQQQISRPETDTSLPKQGS